MQVLCKTSFGTLWLYAYTLGTVDARGTVITSVVSTQDDGPHSMVHFN
jgi:hypothetical protein